jgi:hypothetical protein
MPSGSVSTAENTSSWFSVSVETFVPKLRNRGELDELAEPAEPLPSSVP